MKSLRHILSFILAIVLVSALTGCKPSMPSDVLSKGDMVDILYDYHLAQAAAEVSSDRALNARVYRLAVLKKHEVTEAEFDSSMVYYTRHTELLHDVYSQLADRLQSEADGLGAMGMGGVTASGDTADIWTGRKSMVLGIQPPFNEESFEFTADSAFHKGDRMMLTFNADFLFQDGVRDGIVVLAMTFKNDSTVQQCIHVNNSSSYSVSVDDADSLGIKKVKGFFLLNKSQDMMGGSTTLKLMLLSNIRLYRMHVKRDAPVQSNPMGGGMPGVTPVGPQPAPGGDTPMPQGTGLPPGAAMPAGVQMAPDQKFVR